MKISNKCLSCPMYEAEVTFDERFYAESPGGTMQMYGNTKTYYNYCHDIDGDCIEPDSQACEINIISQNQMDKLYISFSKDQVETIKRILKLEVEI